MSKLGTTYLFRVKVEKDSVDITKGLNFDVSFFVFPGRRLNYRKEEMARMDNEDGAGYYAVVESTKLGIGPVCADVTIYQEVSSERIGVRPIVVPVAVISVVSTFVVMAASGWVTQAVIRREKRAKGANK